MKNFKFADLFCGVGGFHQALKNLSGECVFATDIDKKAMETYETNYNIKPHYDITTINEKTLPDFEVLCGGFPCQPFSKCGTRGGMNDTKGTLFFEILRILKEKKPKYFILENVVNLLHHDGGNTYKIIIDSLRDLGYRMPANPLILSPHELGISQTRNRLFFIGVYDPTNKYPLEVIKSPTKRYKNLFSENNTTIDIITKKLKQTIYDICDPNLPITPELKIKPEVEKSIDMWDEFFKYYLQNGATGPRNFFLECVYDHYPLRIRQQNYKKAILGYYKKHKEWIDAWVTRNDMLKLPITHQHWLFHEPPKVKSLWDCIIQLRANGFIYTQTGICPTLVRSGFPPIIGKYRRHMSASEYCELQSFNEDYIQNENHKATYNQLGNAVNVKVIETIAKELFKIV